MSAIDLFSQIPAPAKAPTAPLVGHGIPLRHCQRQDVDALMYAIDTGHNKPCCVAATGYGKGGLIAEVAGRLRAGGGGKVVCLVDRAHLVHQLADEIERHLGITCGRVADGVKDGIHRHTVVSTVQAMYDTGSGETPLYELPQFDDTRHVIADEAHKFFAPCFRSPIEHFIENHGATCVFFTATPVAANGAPWQSFINWTPEAEGPCMRTAGWCIRNGYLVPLKQAFIHVDLDLRPLYDRLSDTLPGVDDEADDDSAAVLLDLLNDKGEQDAARFAAGVVDVIGSRRAVVFSPPRVSAAKLMASWLKATGRVTCESVWGARADKSDVLAFARQYGRPQVLTNAQILCEGWDDPNVSAAFICRLVKNWRLITQMVGRVLRPSRDIANRLSELDGPDRADERRAAIAASSKPDALVADLVGIDGTVLQASAVDVLYADATPEERREMGDIIHKRKLHDSGAQAPDEATLQEARRAILTRQHEQLAELARRRGMAGEISADVTVTYERGGAVTLPDLPTPRQLATEGEMARFVAYAIQYDVERAVNIAERTPRHVLRGMTQGMVRKVEKDGKQPDWGRARRCYPQWANERRRA